MKKIGFIDVIKERNIYTDKKVSLLARLMTYFLSFVLLFFLFFLFVERYTSKFWFSVFIAASCSFVIAAWFILFTKNKYTAEMNIKKSNYLQKKRIENLYLLSENEISDLSLQILLQKIENAKIVRNGAFLFCNGIPISFMNIGTRKISSCGKINMFLNMGYRKVIAVCTEEQKREIEKIYTDSVEFFITDTEIAQNYNFLEYDFQIKNKFNILSIFNNKTASAFIRLSVICAVLGLICGNMRYFGGICIVFCIMGSAIKTVSTLLKVRK